MSKKGRPTTLDIPLSAPIATVEQSSRLRDDENEEDSQYIQLKPMHKSYSEPNMLAASPREAAGFHDSLHEKRSYSSPYILEGYSRKSISEDMPVKKEYYALFCLGPKNPIRRAAINITESKYPFHLTFLTL